VHASSEDIRDAITSASTLQLGDSRRYGLGLKWFSGCAWLSMDSYLRFKDGGISAAMSLAYLVSATHLICNAILTTTSVLLIQYVPATLFPLSKSNTKTIVQFMPAALVI
jgi:hypothetical protein